MTNRFLVRSIGFEIPILVVKQCFILLEMMPSVDGVLLPLSHVITMKWFRPTREGICMVNRVITPLSRALFQSLSTSNIAPDDQYSVSANEPGGFSQVSFIPFDFANM